jgi:hypothetical protein
MFKLMKIGQHKYIYILRLEIGLINYSLYLPFLKKIKVPPIFFNSLNESF